MGGRGGAAPVGAGGGSRWGAGGARRPAPPPAPLHPPLASPILFGAVARLIRRALPVFRVPVPLVPLGHADAHGDGLLVASLLGARAGGLLPRPQAAAGGEGLPRHRLARPLEQGHAGVARRAAEQRRELLAAGAEDGAPGA